MKYIGILLVILSILISILVSCDSQSQPEISNDYNFIDSNYLKNCPIFKCDKTIDSMSIQLDEIQKRLKK